MIAGSVPLPFSFFLFPTPPTFCVPFSFSSSPLSKSLEQASRWVMLWFSFIIGVRLYLSVVLSYVMYDNEFETKGQNVIIKTHVCACMCHMHIQVFNHYAANQSFIFWQNLSGVSQKIKYELCVSKCLRYVSAVLNNAFFDSKVY